MSDNAASLRRKIANAGDLQSVVRTMKTLAASNIAQYEASVRALDEYYRTVELALGVCFRAVGSVTPQAPQPKVSSGDAIVGAIVFGSDQGLVGQFNEVIVDLAVKALATLPGTHRVWAVGARVHARLADAGLPLVGELPLPSAVDGIAQLVSRVVVECETPHDGRENTELHLFYNRPTSGSGYAPVTERLLPLDDAWRKRLTATRWPTKALPEVMGDLTATLRALIRSYLFISIFRACADSLASENASRLAAMQRADKNIDDIIEDLTSTFHRFRQASIDEELFDVIAGFEALSKPAGP